MSLPKAVGIYWAKAPQATTYHLLVRISGSAPFLSAQKLCNLSTAYDCDPMQADYATAQLKIPEVPGA